MMGKELWGLKRCSTSTVAESSDPKDDEKPTLQEAEREQQNPETDVKKQKKRKKKSKSKQIAEDDNLEPKKKTSEEKEMKKLRKSFNEMTQTLKNLQSILGSDSYPPGMSLTDLLLKRVPPDTSSKKKEEPPKELETYECCYKTEDAEGNRESIFVHGFDNRLARDVIKSALRTYFESGGLKVERVFVPIECQTGVSLGYAFVDVDDDEKALLLHGGSLLGRTLYVLKAVDQPESAELSDFVGCRRCGTYLAKRRHERHVRSLSRRTCSRYN